MSVEEYQRQADALGIGRGELSAGFRELRPNGNHATGHEAGDRWWLPVSVSAETLGLALEDMSHLNPKRKAKGGRPRKVK